MSASASATASDPRRRDESRHRAFVCGVDRGLLASPAASSARARSRQRRRDRAALRRARLWAGSAPATETRNSWARCCAPCRLRSCRRRRSSRAARSARRCSREAMPSPIRSNSPISAAAAAMALTPSSRHARMRLAARDARAVGIDALMRVDHRHAGRLADDDGARPRQVLAEPGDQRPHAGAADLLVIGDDDVDRLFQLPRLESGTAASTQAIKPFMSQAAAAVKLAVALGQREGVGRPALAFDRHAIAVAREPDAALAFRSDGGEQVGLGAIGRGHARRGDAVAFEVILDEGDQREIRLCAGGVEGDERPQQLLCESKGLCGSIAASLSAGEALAADRARALSASISRSRGGAVVTSESISSRAARETLSTARSKAA